MIVDNNALKFRKDNLEIFEVIGRLNKDLKEVLFSSSNELNSLIINFKQKKIFELYHKNLENLNKKRHRIVLLKSNIRSSFDWLSG